MSPDGRSLLGAGGLLLADRARPARVGGTASRAAAVACRTTDVAFAATVSCISFEQLKWQVAGVGRLRLFDVLTVLFVLAFAAERLLNRDRVVGRAEAIVGIFGVALLLAYLGGAFALETEFARVRFARGIATFGIHFSLLAAGVAYLVRRRRRFYWLTLGYLCAGMAMGAAYAAVQLITAKVGVNLDRLVLEPLTHTPVRTLAYSLETGPNIIRVRGLTTDPNHLGIMLLVPLLTLPSLAAPLPLGSRQRILLGISLAGFIVVEAATFSRSALLGLVAGLLVLVVYDRRAVFSRVLLLPAASATVLLVAVTAQHPHFYRRVFLSRLNAYELQKRMPGHLELYDYVPRTLHSHPLFGTGLDTFSAFYTSIPRDYGPLSFYVQSLVETGVVATVIFAAFLGYAFVSLWKLRRIGTAWARPLSAGLAAALVGTMAANVFYLTMTSAYFYVLLILVLAAPVVFARRETA
jgi:hypothetical protein